MVCSSLQRLSLTKNSMRISAIDNNAMAAPTLANLPSNFDLIERAPSPARWMCGSLDAVGKGWMRFVKWGLLG